VAFAWDISSAKPQAEINVDNLIKLACVLFVLALSAIASLGLPIPLPDDMPTWHSDWARAQRIAQRDSKPIFAVLVCKH